MLSVTLRSQSRLLRGQIAVRRFDSDQYSIKTHIHECINESGIDGVRVQRCFASDAQFSKECEVLFLLMYSNSADMLFPQQQRVQWIFVCELFS